MPRPEPQGLRRRARFPEPRASQQVHAPAPHCPQGALPVGPSEGGPLAVLVVAQASSVRNTVTGELAHCFELLNATTFSSAARKLDAGPCLSAVIVDLDLNDGPGAGWLLARLVDHAFEGPRLLLSSALGPEHASCLRRGSVSHFTLARPWSSGELLVSLVSALGYSPPPARLQDM
jgi:hypothetical protein